MGYQQPFRVVSILEELVHVCLKVRDENLTKRIVIALYEEMDLVNHNYVLKSKQQN
jgi:hypothetical protein